MTHTPISSPLLQSQPSLLLQSQPDFPWCDHRKFKIIHLFRMVGLCWFALKMFICNDEEEYINVDGGEEGDKKKFYDEG